MTGDVRAAAERLRSQLVGDPGWYSQAGRDLATLLAEHDRLAAADPVAVVAGVDLEGVLAGHTRHCWADGEGCFGCEWTGTRGGFFGHQAEVVRAALTEALGGGAP